MKAKRRNRPLSLETIYGILTAFESSGMLRSHFGREFFRDPTFLSRLSAERGYRRVTHTRATAVLQMLADGHFVPIKPVMSTDVLPRLVAAVKASKLTEGVFAAKYLGHGWAINRLRRQPPHLLTAKATARIDAACEAVLGPAGDRETPRE